jgi:hypothetical protein
MLWGARVTDDILSHGDDRGPGQWPRRLTVIAALIAVVVGGAVYLSIPRHHGAPAAARQTPGTALPSPVIPSASGAPAVPAGPNGITGRTLAWDRSLRLPAAGSRPIWFSPASGRSEPIAGLPADPSGYQFTRVAGGWAVRSSSAAPAPCGSCAEAEAPVWFLADGGRSATQLGTANLVAPAATAGTAWLTSYRPGANMSTAAGAAREAGDTGAPERSRPVRLPPGYAIVRGTDRGLLLAPVSQPPGTAAYLLWDPSAPRASQVFHGVLATSAAEIAWTPRCARPGGTTPPNPPGARCGIQLLDLATGRHTEVALPAGSSAVSGAFSPDGGYLALQVSFGSTGDGGELAMQLEVAPVTTGRLAVVPGTWVSSDALIGFGWPARGDSLVAEFSFTTKMELAAWRPGTSYPSVKVIRPGPGQAFYILG